MATIKELEKKTKEFFENYWSSNIDDEHPGWKGPWDFNGPIPNHDNGGCYALVRNDEVIYIGVGISEGEGIYEGNGLGYRLHNYWKLNKNPNISKKYIPKNNQIDFTDIMTIGFEKDHSHLAAALEIYLIRELHPEGNYQHTKK